MATKRTMVLTPKSKPTMILRKKATPHSPKTGRVRYARTTKKTA